MGVFDEIIVLDETSSFTVATIARPGGPLDEGLFDATGTWVPDPGARNLEVPGFGIDKNGLPYYDTEQVTPGDESQLWIDVVNDLIWLEKS